MKNLLNFNLSEKESEKAFELFDAARESLNQTTESFRTLFEHLESEHISLSPKLQKKLSLEMEKAYSYAWKMRVQNLQINDSSRELKEELQPEQD
jgi:hypothetical protein